MRRRLLLAGLVTVVLAAAATWFVLGRQRDAALDDRLTAGTCSTDGRSDPTRPAGQNHVPSPTFSVDPPAGGDHTANVASTGQYTPGQVQDGPAVHALEHGYIVLWHRSGLADAERQRLEDVRNRHVRDVLMIERPSLPVPVAATAWGHRLLCQQVEDDALAAFIDAYVNEGPERVPH